MTKISNFEKLSYMGVELYAPKRFWGLLATNPEKIKEISNGCGAAGSMDFVPDRFYGLKVTPCCDIHDLCYYFGGSEDDKILSDVFLLINLLFWIKAKSNTFMRVLRNGRAIKYYTACDLYGHDAFNYTD